MLLPLLYVLVWVWLLGFDFYWFWFLFLMFIEGIFYLIIGISLVLFGKVTNEMFETHYKDKE